MSSKSGNHTSYWFYKASCLLVVEHPKGSIVHPKPSLQWSPLNRDGMWLTLEEQVCHYFAAFFTASRSSRQQRRPGFCAGSRLWYGRSRCNDGGSTREPIPYTRPINPAPITCPRYMHSINWADWASQTVFWTKMITITFLSSGGKAIPWTNYFVGKRGVGMGSTWFCITTTVSSLLSAPTMHLNGITNFILQG